MYYLKWYIFLWRTQILSKLNRVHCSCFARALNLPISEPPYIVLVSVLTLPHFPACSATRKGCTAFHSNSLSFTGVASSEQSKQIPTMSSSISVQQETLSSAEFQNALLDVLQWLTEITAGRCTPEKIPSILCKPDFDPKLLANGAKSSKQSKNIAKAFTDRKRKSIWHNFCASLTQRKSPLCNTYIRQIPVQ